MLVEAGPNRAMSEFEWIRKYFAPLATSEGAVGLKDDVAALSEPEGPLAITVDTLVEGVHFLASDPIDTVARKLVRVNVSDLLSKGARPSEALLSIAWPSGRGEAELARFATALGDELSQQEASLVGGDTVITHGPLVLTLTLTGVCEGDGPVRRSDASPGDDVWITGDIGAGGLGLSAATSGQEGRWLDRYRVPKIAPLAAADMIAEFAGASMDVSDGLLADAAKLCRASAVQLHIDLDRVPFAEQPGEVERALVLSSAGDDYQILFTADPAIRAELTAFAADEGLELTAIGHVSEGAGLTASYQSNAVNLPETLGFEHDV